MLKICELWSCDMNSTLGSVVPLAMFLILVLCKYDSVGFDILSDIHCFTFFVHCCLVLRIFYSIWHIQSSIVCFLRWYLKQDDTGKEHFVFTWLTMTQFFLFVRIVLDLSRSLDRKGMEPKQDPVFSISIGNLTLPTLSRDKVLLEQSIAWDFLENNSRR